jgi:hypothetical protein
MGFSLAAEVVAKKMPERECLRDKALPLFEIPSYIHQRLPAGWPAPPAPGLPREGVNHHLIALRTSNRIAHDVYYFDLLHALIVLRPCSRKRWME